MIIQVFKKAVFIISMLMIIGLSGCKKNAGEDYRLPVASPTVLSPPLSTGWAALGNLPDEFSPDGGNFFLGIKNNVFAISPKGTVWQYNVTGGYSLGFAASIPESMPEPAVTFSVNGMGYCIEKSHCWQFNPAMNQWIRKKDPPGVSLGAPLVIGDKVYLRTTDSNHLFAYDPATDTYTQQKDPPDFGNYLLGYFVLNEYGYYIGASGGCWKYDASIDHWQQRAGFTGMDKVYSEASFSVGDTGYVLEDNAYASVAQLNLWRYDAALNLWTKTNDYYPGDGFNGLQAVSLDSFACIGLGVNDGGDYYVKDFWRYK
jgi:hypothetical protein